jgi:6-phosphogluconolactonase
MKKFLKVIRHHPLLWLLAFVPLVFAAAASPYEYLVLVGTYTGKGSEGIYAYRFDPATGESTPVARVASTDNPSFLAVDSGARFLYAVNELDTFHNEPTGAVSVFAMDRETGKLKLLQQVSSLGAGPAHLSLDKSGRFLMVANYNGGNVAVFPIGKDGRLGPHSAFVQNAGSSVNPHRQTGPHAHFVQVTPDNQFVIVADLGLDQLLIHQFDAHTGSLIPGHPKSVKVAPGAGPRHVAFAPSGKLMYVVNELNSSVTVFTYHPESGSLQEQQTISTLPENFAGHNTAAQILVDARGGYLYVSNRGDDSIVVFRTNPKNGTLTPVEWVPSGGKTPRNFAIDPSGKWMFVANQDSNNLKLFQIDSSSGRLLPRSGSLEIVSPVCVCIVPLK